MKRRLQGKPSQYGEMMRQGLLIKLLVFILILFLMPFLFYSQEDDVFAKRRKNMVKRQLAGRDITDKKIKTIINKRIKYFI